MHWDDQTALDMLEIYGVDVEQCWGTPWWQTRTRIIGLLDRGNARITRALSA